MTTDPSTPAWRIPGGCKSQTRLSDYFNIFQQQEITVHRVTFAWEKAAAAFSLQPKSCWA